MASTKQVNRCWEKVGYPSWHYKSKQNQSNKSGNQAKNKGMVNNSGKKVAAHVDGSHIMFTFKQFEQLLKNLPSMSSHQSNGDFGEDLDHQFVAGNATSSSPYVDG